MRAVRRSRYLRGAANGSLGLDALIIAGDVLGDDQHWALRYPAPADAIADRGVAALALTGTRGGRDAAALVAWFAVGPAGGEVALTGLAGKDVWARDRATQERLGGTAVQSGDPVLLAGRVFSPDALRRRADLLRMCGALPVGRRLVIEGVPEPCSLARRRTPGRRNRLDTEHRSQALGGRGESRPDTRWRRLSVPGLIAERVHHLPEWVGLDDIAAAMSGSVAVVAMSPAGAHLAASLGVPVSAIDLGLRERFDPAIPVIHADISEAIQRLVAGKHPVAIDAAVQTLDGALAELAERLPRTAGSARTALEPDAVTSALAILQRRLVDERIALQAELSRVQSELDHLRASPEHRLARPIREGYQRWQRRRT